jgi:hypothetical protein
VPAPRPGAGGTLVGAALVGGAALIAGGIFYAEYRILYSYYSPGYR